MRDFAQSEKFLMIYTCIIQLRYTGINDRVSPVLGYSYFPSVFLVSPSFLYNWCSIHTSVTYCQHILCDGPCQFVSLFIQIRIISLVMIHYIVSWQYFVVTCRIVLFWIGFKYENDVWKGSHSITIFVSILNVIVYVLNVFIWLLPVTFSNW